MATAKRSRRSGHDIALDIAVRAVSEDREASPRTLRVEGATPVALRSPPLLAPDSWRLTLALGARVAPLRVHVDTGEPCLLTVAANGAIVARGAASHGLPLTFTVDRLALCFIAPDAPVAWEARFRLDAAGAAGRQVRRVRKSGWRGRVLLRQHGAALTGFLAFGAALFPVDGTASAEADGAVRLELRGTGRLDGELAALALAGTVRGNCLSGSYTVALARGGALLCGGALFDGLMCQDPPGQQPQGPAGPPAPPGDECGALLWTSEVFRGKFGPADSRRDYRFRVRRYERCVRVEYLDAAGNVVGTSELSPDLNQPLPGGKRILVFDRALNGDPLTRAGDGQLRVTGESKVILVQGCARIHFVQYVRNTLTVYNAAGAQDSHEELPWALDGGDHFPGTFERLPAGAAPDSGGMADVPGMDAEHVAAADDLAKLLLKDARNGARFVFNFELEAFVCCDGTLLGAVAWGCELTWTKANGQISGPVAAKVAPVWRRVNQTANGANVRCAH